MASKPLIVKQVLVASQNETSFRSGEDIVVFMNSLINCFIVHIVTIVGSLGNIITLIVLARIGFKDTSNILLFSLASCDLFFLAVLSLRKLDCIIARFDPVLAQIYQPYIQSYIWVPGRLPMLIGITHLVVISCERLVAVFYPLHVSNWITPRKVVVGLACIYIAWIMYVMPWAISYLRVEWMFSSVRNRPIVVARKTQWYTDNEQTLNLLLEFVVNILTGLFPFIVAANCCAVACKLRIISKRRFRMTLRTTPSPGIDSKISRMLLVVCVVFCLCNSPAVAIYIYFYLDQSMKPPNTLYSLLSDLEELFLAINAAANFFIYILMSAKFYKSVMTVLRCRKVPSNSISLKNLR